MTSLKQHNNRKINRRGVHQLVAKHQEPNASTAKRHDHDIKCAALTLHNSIVDSSRKGRIDRLSFIDIVTETSAFIEETTLTKEKVGCLESTMKQNLRHFYFEDSDGCRHDHRMPTKANAFKRFSKKKTSRVKDHALTFVTEMCKQDQLDRKAVADEIREQELTVSI